MRLSVQREIYRLHDHLLRPAAFRAFGFVKMTLFDGRLQITLSDQLHPFLMRVFCLIGPLRILLDQLHVLSVFMDRCRGSSVMRKAKVYLQAVFLGDPPARIAREYVVLFQICVDPEVSLQSGTEVARPIFYLQDAGRMLYPLLFPRLFRIYHVVSSVSIFCVSFTRRALPFLDMLALLPSGD